MVKETTILGIAGIIIGIISFIKTGKVGLPVIIVIISILMMTLGKNENKIESRQDK